MELNGIGLTVCKGEALGIIGINGTGKSTLQ
jgi:ABC-type polysaccharide/polyol phosphate transport system ATPase subunit